ncbi:MAG: DNA-binding protein [Chloroflexi bacterium]|nr:DNA-binding protein [Chloroflexota bacterium]|tara:strand:+ start:3666 stop:4328 length:663 start_codon:yes stop_codon:yes gene_type:complete
MTLSNTVEDYLLAIYGMRADAEAVINARLAERLHVAPPTVTATLERMVRDGHIWIDDNHQVFLTLSGERSAERLARRHRLIEHWLIRTLGLGWADVHEEADRLEHSVSEELTEHISESLGHPATCPHGLPIPGNYPETDVSQIINLGQVEAGADVRIVRLSETAEDDGELLHYFENKQLVPGRVMRITETTPSGHLVVELDGATVVIDDKVASNLWVMRA